MNGLAPAQNIWSVPRSKQLHSLKTEESMIFLLAMTAVAGEFQPVQVKGEKPTVPDECEMGKVVGTVAVSQGETHSVVQVATQAFLEETMFNNQSGKQIKFDMLAIPTGVEAKSTGERIPVEQLGNRIVRVVSESAMVEVSPVSQLLSGQTGVGKTAEQSLVPGSSTKLGLGDWPEMPSPWTGKPPPEGKAILFEPKSGISARQEENITIQGASVKQVQDGNIQPGMSNRSITQAFLEETLFNNQSGKQIKTSNVESAKPLFAGIALPSGVEVKATGVGVPVEQLGNRIAVEVIQAIVFDRQKTSKVQLKLEPEHLGKITIKLVAVNGEITARFFTESAQAKEAIESSLNQLRESLQPYRMHLGETSVSLGMEGDGWQGGRDERFIPMDRDFQKDQELGNSVCGAGESEKPVEMCPWTVNYLV